MTNHEGVIGFLEHHRNVALRQSENRLADPGDAASSRLWSQQLARAIAELKAAQR